jgi:HAMP domain-containing protein
LPCQTILLSEGGYNVAAMRLLIKFNLVLILVFGSGVAIAGYLSHQFLERSAREQVLEQARLMMGAAGGMRTYTSKQVGPLLKAHQQRINRFLPQTVPAYSATEVFTYLRTTYPDYSYKEASLNPTNLRNRAVDWETDVIQIFRNHPELKEFSSERETPAGRVLFLAKPLVVDMPCLQCHSTPDKAPPAMIKVYGEDHGFGWNVGEPIAAQVVSVPMTVPLNIADQAFKTLMFSLGGISLLTLIFLDLAIILVVIRPVTRLARTADRISNGDLNVPEIPAKGSDEIADLARSFNRMYLSLVKAIRMLESQ